MNISCVVTALSLCAIAIRLAIKIGELDSRIEKLEKSHREVNDE